MEKSLPLTHNRSQNGDGQYIETVFMTGTAGFWKNSVLEDLLQKSCMPTKVIYERKAFSIYTATVQNQQRGWCERDCGCNDVPAVSIIEHPMFPAGQQNTPISSILQLFAVV